MKSSVVKPGEIRILKALKEEPLSDKEIKEKASLVNSNIRIRYLRNLWKSGLITRDIDTRKYSIAPQGLEMLRLVYEWKLVEDKMKLLLDEKEVVDIPGRKVNG